MQKNGNRKFVSNFVVMGVVIVNGTSPGHCKAIVVLLQGKDKPLIFYEGDISPAALRRQTCFFKKGTTISREVVCESFIRAVKMCCNVFFLTIPEHSGGNFLEGGVYNYTSALSVIPGLEELYADEIRQHHLIQHKRKFEEVTAEYRNLFPNCWKVKLAIAIRVMSLLLPFYETEGLKTDSFFVFSTNSTSRKETLIALTSRFNYESPIVISVSNRITKIKETLATGNDVTAIFTYSYNIDDTRAFMNALNEIYRAVTCENGFDTSARKIIEVITDVPGSIPEEYPVYYLSFTDDVRNVNIQTIQRLSGEMDYSLIQFLTNNPDSAKKLIHQAVLNAKKLVSSMIDAERVETMTMLIATFVLLKSFGIVSENEVQAVLSWFKHEAASRISITEEICRMFKSAVCQSILSGELKIAKQFGLPYYSDDGHTAFIADVDQSINFNDDVIKKIILPKIPMINNVPQLNKCLNEKGMLIGTHTNKRKFKVAYDAGVFEQFELFSYRKSVLDAEADSYVTNIIYNEFWYNVGEYPEGFVPVLSNTDGTKAAGYVLGKNMDINRHEIYSGISRSGKSFALIQTLLFRAERGETVLIFDQSGSFTKRELEKHIDPELISEFFSFWDVYQDGLPVDLINLEGCLSYRDKKERLKRIYALMSRTLGSYEEQILDSAVRRMLQDRKRNLDLNLFDIMDYIRNDIDVDGKRIKDEAHKKLLYKIEAILDDLRETPAARYNWSEFVQEQCGEKQSKSVIVISTGADSVGKHCEMIDMMLESLYHFKQCYPDKKYTVVIDEVQDLYLHEKSSVSTMLRKEGKNGVSMLLASQAFPDGSTLLGKAVGNCGRVRGYHPKANDLIHAASYFECDSRDVDVLRQGECFDKGLFFSRYRGENVNATLKGRTVIFASVSDNES
ncbi:MAG: hypothetical protein E7496_12495 [Ruminococcus sp.]|nr:hypothetical protein [Ruminococcus sp.]